MMKKIGLFFGGMSNEAEVSINSAKNIVKHFDHTKHTLVLVYWSKDGDFYVVKNIEKLKEKQPLAIADFHKTFDIALPITHGKYGEDGILQSVFTIQKIPYCGCHVLSSVLCMDKSLFKKYLAGHGIPQTRFVDIDLRLMTQTDIEKKMKEIKNIPLPLYVKPANSGSSIGISKVTTYEQLDKAVKEASKHDSKILVEEGLMSPQEVEIAVLGNNKLIISEPGELLLAKDFYDYEDKYKNNEAILRIPAKISNEQKKEIQQLAIKAYKLCDCSGFARIDFFIAGKKIYLNEINTLPGFTDTSMFPMLMTKHKMSYTQLIDKIIDLAY